MKWEKDGGAAPMLEQRRPVPLGQQLLHSFAGFLGHLLNTGRDGVVPIQLGELEIAILGVLAGGQGRQGADENRADGNKNSPYVQSLVGLPLFAPGTTPAQAATTYFDRVLNRRLFLVRNNLEHRGHQVFLALCRRGVDEPWRTAELVRRNSNSQGRLLLPPSGFGDVRARLKAFGNPDGPHISGGNPARSTRDQHGPLYVNVGGYIAEVPEEMSIWQAICCAPSVLTLLPTTQFNLFSSLMLKAVEVANKPYGLRVALKMSPTDTDEYATHTLKKTLAFRSATRALARQLNANQNEMEIWRLAWSAHAIPGYATVEKFRDSPLGRYLWLGSTFAEDDPGDAKEPDEAGLADQMEPEEGDEPIGGIEEKQFRSSIGPWIDELAEAGVLWPYDEWYLRGRAEGKDLAWLARSLKTFKRFGRFAIPVSYEAGLLARIRQYNRDKE